MQLAILANDRQWMEWVEGNPAISEFLVNDSAHSANAVLSIVKTDNLEAFLGIKADIYIDLLFDESHLSINKNNTSEWRKRVKQLTGLLPNLVLVNAVDSTLGEIHPDFCRVNGWNGFIGKKTWEIVSLKDEQTARLQALAQLLSMEFINVPDIAGMISPRVIAMIVNEGYFALGDGVSTKPEIDTAMKLGTNYPEGPFTWSEKIGLSHIYQLLLRLSANEEKYRPAPAMQAMFT